MIDRHAKKNRALVIEPLKGPRLPMGLPGREGDLHYFLSAPAVCRGGLRLVRFW
jgi:hypothetical protein